MRSRLPGRVPVVCEMPGEVPDPGPFGASRLLFRGQADANWLLRTTLERALPDDIEVEDYLMCAARCAKEIGAFTGRDLGIPDWPTVRAQARAGLGQPPFELPLVSYLAYLRQYGFRRRYLTGRLHPTSRPSSLGLSLRTRNGWPCTPWP